MGAKVKVTIVGATGYTGGELLRLLLSHPGVEVIALFRLSSEEALPVSRFHPHLRGLTDLECRPYEEGEAAKGDAVFLAVPNGIAMELVPPLLRKGVRIIDLSADFRLRDPEIYREWYRKSHSAPSLLPEAVYGLPELWRSQIRGARVLANPGCYPVSVLLSAAPLVRRGLVDLESLIVDSKSGVSGAGRSRLEVGYLFSELNDDFRAYSVAGHRHIPEMEQQLTLLAGHPVALTFTPHLVPMTRGLFTTLYARLKEPLSLTALFDLYGNDYAKEPFIRLLPPGEVPRTKAVIGSNFCDLGLFVDERSRRVIVLSALDNLIKGAAGNAVQSFNLMFGMDERMGLWGPGLMP